MTRVGPFNPHRLQLVAIVVGVSFVGPFFVAHAIGVRINLSPSLPIGLYLETSDLRTRLIEFCPAEPYATFAMERGYRSAGNCPDGGAPLMKPIVAIAGDVVRISADGLAVNGVLVPNTSVQWRDAQGRPMRSWVPGIYRVPPGQIWVASSFNPWSYDSRYFGAVPVSLIRSRLRPFLTFSHSDSQ